MVIVYDSQNSLSFRFKGLTDTREQAVGCPLRASRKSESFWGASFLFSFCPLEFSPDSVGSFSIVGSSLDCFCESGRIRSLDFPFYVFVWPAESDLAGSSLEDTFYFLELRSLIIDSPKKLYGCPIYPF